MTKKLTFKAVNCGDVLPAIEQHISQDIIWKHAVASLDYNPVHTNPDWCKTAQVFGLPVPVMHGNQTMSLMATVVTNWAYPSGGWLKKMEVKLIKPVPVGSTCTYGAAVIEKHFAGEGENYITVDLWAMNQDGEKVAAGTTDVVLPD